MNSLSLDKGMRETTHPPHPALVGHPSQKISSRAPSSANNKGCTNPERRLPSAPAFLQTDTSSSSSPLEQSYRSLQDACDSSMSRPSDSASPLSSEEGDPAARHCRRNCRTRRASLKMCLARL